MTASLSQTIASHIVQTRFEHLSPRAIQMTKYSLLDALGVMLGASGIGEGCDAFARLAMESNAKRESTMLGYGERTSASLAALANGALAHALDFEDAHDSAPVHPNAQTIPAALALAESLGSINGRDLITALAVGCDLVCRLGMCLTTNLDDYGWYPPPILGAFGATAAAARLLKLNERQTLDALSLALCQVGCSAELKYNPHSVVRSVRDSFAAQTGVVAAQLAQNGVRGFDMPFEGKAGFFNNYARGHYDENKLLDKLGTYFQGENLSFKPWPACRGTHAYIDCALQLTRTHALQASDIASGHLIGHPVQKMLYEPLAQKQKPATAIDAKFSLPFTVASALLHGEVTLASFRPEALHDAAVLELASRLTFEVSTDPSATDNATRGQLTLITKSGAQYSMFVENPLGHFSRPMSQDQLIQKFQQCARLAKKPLPQSGIERLLEGVLKLDEYGTLDAQFFSRLQS
jgi:2-methylcitrate dehydratase PrpD